MDTILTEPLRLRNDLCRDTNRDDVQRDDVLRDAKELAERGDTLLLGVNSTPGATIAKGVCCKEHVLCGRRTVLDPVARDLLEGWLGADNNGHTGGLDKRGVGVHLVDLGKHGLVADHNKVPWLGVHGAGCVHPGLNNLAHVFVGDLLAGVKLAGGAAALDNVLDKVCHFF